MVTLTIAKVQSLIQRARAVFILDTYVAVLHSSCPPISLSLSLSQPCLVRTALNVPFTFRSHPTFFLAHCLAEAVMDGIDDSCAPSRTCTLAPGSQDERPADFIVLHFCCTRGRVFTHTVTSPGEEEKGGVEKTRRAGGEIQKHFSFPENIAITQNKRPSFYPQPLAPPKPFSPPSIKSPITH